MASTTHSAMAQYVRPHFYRPVVIAPALIDSNYVIRPQWLNLGNWQNGIPPQVDLYREPWLPVVYSPALKAQFRPYPKANRELERAEQYSQKATRWMQVGYAASLANNSFSSPSWNAQINNGLSLLTLGSLIPGIIYGTKSNQYRREAIRYFNRGE